MGEEKKKKKEVNKTAVTINILVQYIDLFQIYSVQWNIPTTKMYSLNPILFIVLLGTYQSHLFLNIYTAA